MKEELETIRKKMRVLRIKSHIIILEKEQQEFEELPQAFEEMEIEEGIKIDEKISLLDVVLQNRGFPKEEKKKRLPFVTFPPKPKIFPTKPILLDIVNFLLIEGL